MDENQIGRRYHGSPGKLSFLVLQRLALLAPGYIEGLSDDELRMHADALEKDIQVLSGSLTDLALEAARRLSTMVELTAGTE